jgi:hypothetical protein
MTLEIRKGVNITERTKTEPVSRFKRTAIKSPSTV